MMKQNLIELLLLCGIQGMWGEEADEDGDYPE